MNFRIFCASMVVSCLCSTALSAEPIRINPYPEKAQAAAAQPTAGQIVEEAVQDVQPTQPVMASPKPAVSTNYRVPQPGDDYFDPPSQVREVVVVEAEEDLELLPPVEEIAPEQAYEPAAGNLRVSMSENFDDLVVVEGEPAVQVVEVEPQVEPIVAPAPAPEKIAWFSSRQLPQTRVEEASIEAPRDGLVKIAMNQDGTARTEELLAEDAPVGQKWKALEGANIRHVLQQWAQMEGTKLVWDNSDAFAVLQSLEIRGPFHSAVKNLLDQYQDNQVRPVATLHVDPGSGEKTLVVRVLDGA